MFGKERSDKEQSEEDEDWGPHRRKRRRDAGCVDENGCSSTAVKESDSREKKPVFRIPTNAVEVIRCLHLSKVLFTTLVVLFSELFAAAFFESEKFMLWNNLEANFRLETSYYGTIIVGIEED